MSPHFSVQYLAFVLVTFALVGAEREYCKSDSEKLSNLQETMQEITSISRNIQQYVWSEGNALHGQPSGTIKTVKFAKKRINSSLKLTWSGNLQINTRASSATNGCVRWFFKINNEECQDPAPIDGNIYHDNNLNHHQHTTIVGICKVPSAGEITISFHSGQCEKNSQLAPHSSCWSSVCRFIVEEL